MMLRRTMGVRNRDAIIGRNYGPKVDHMVDRMVDRMVDHALFATPRPGETARRTQYNAGRSTFRSTFGPP